MSDDIPNRAKFKPNEGRKPPGSKGKRVRVILNHGREPAYGADWDPQAAPGWAADTTNWTKDPQYSFAVAFYLIL